MTLPTFLGVGTQKAGTTWLHTQLQSHPEVYLPTRRKELHFFDAYFEKGVNWYKSFFPVNPVEKGYRHWGEITPKYMFDPVVVDRVVDTLGPKTKIIFVLRCPVDRFFSQYRMSYSQGDTNLSPEAFFRSNLEAFQRGLYSKQISRFVARFGWSNVLVLFYEKLFLEAYDGIPESLLDIGRFLEINNRLWPTVDAAERLGALGSAGRPRFMGLYELAKRWRKWCMNRDLEGVVRFAKRTGINNRTFGGLSGTPQIDDSLKQEVWEAYRADVEEVEELLSTRIDFWGC